MSLTFFQIVNILLVLVFLVLLLRYLWIVYHPRDRQPAFWTHSVKNGLVHKGIKRMKRSYPDKVRFFNWWFQVERLKREQIPGVLAEVGVYRGDSARVLHHLDPDRPIHLFDTFTGFTPEDLTQETGEAATYTPENFFDTNIESVMKKIAGNHNVIIHPGYFPDSASGFREPVALLNLDADLYKPTKAALEFFYPLLSPGGVILVHDYNHKWPGIIKAVDGFTTTIPENMTLLPDMDGTAVIIRNK